MITAPISKRDNQIPKDPNKQTSNVVIRSLVIGGKYTKLNYFGKTLPKTSNLHPTRVVECLDSTSCQIRLVSHDLFMACIIDFPTRKTEVHLIINSRNDKFIHHRLPT